jgi:hypothetical protein
VRARQFHLRRIGAALEVGRLVREQRVRAAQAVEQLVFQLLNILDRHLGVERALRTVHEGVHLEGWGWGRQRAGLKQVFWQG